MHVMVNTKVKADRVSFLVRMGRELHENVTLLYEMDKRRNGDMSFNQWVESVFVDLVKERKDDVLIEGIKDKR